jgi:hypothetical protein
VPHGHDPVALASSKQAAPPKSAYE